MKIGIKLLKGSKYLPIKAHSNDACYDVFATEIESEDERKIVYKAGFSLELEDGYSVELRPRSSIHRKLLLLANSPGTGDAGYKGEYKLVFYKLFPESQRYEVGDRIGQIRIVEDANVDWEVVTGLSESSRGLGGFGSSDDLVESTDGKLTYFDIVEIDSLFFSDGEKFMKIGYETAYSTETGQTSIFSSEQLVRT